MTSHGRRPKLWDNLKILIVEYISNHWLDLAQILNLSLYDQIKITNAFGRQTKLEDNLKILIVEYLRNHWSEFAHILNVSLYDQCKV